MKYQILDGGYPLQRAHFDDAGIDFRCPEEVTLFAHDSKVIDLRVAVQIPVGQVGFMKSKSGLMVNHGVICLGGVIDSGFRGSLRVRMMNTSDTPYTFKKGDKVVEMVLCDTQLCDLVQSPYLDDSVSGRGDNGYGSTGR